MYKISQLIKSKFSAYTKPSFGAIKPALKRLEKFNFIKSRKTLSDGGKQFAFYEITKLGREKLIELLLQEVSSNPLQFFATAHIKLACAALLEPVQRAQLFQNLKNLALNHKIDAENIADDEYISLDFYQRVVLDNAICEYKNLVMLIEGLEKENVGNC